MRLQEVSDTALATDKLRKCVQDKVLFRQYETVWTEL